jgi:RNA polymerase sigma-70 factor (ECF subfamily)
VKKSKREREQEILEEFRQYGRTDELVREYWNLVYFTARETLLFHKIPYTNDDIDDLRVEVFLQLFKNNCRRLKQYDASKGLSLSGWIKLVANHTTLNEIKKRGVLELGKQNFRMPIDELREMLAYNEKDRIEAREELKITLEAMEKLPARDREVLRLYFLECRSLEEIAESIGKSYGTASTIISRAKKKLRKLVEDKLNR